MESNIITLLNMKKNKILRLEEIAKELLVEDIDRFNEAIKKLEEEGYVRREKDNLDKRANKVFLTEKGMDIKEDIYKILSQWESIISQSLEKEERILMINLLQVMK